MDVPLTLAARDSSALQGATIASYGFLRASAESSQFVSDYKNQFGGAPVGSFPGLGFETVGLLEDAIAKANSTRPSALEQALLGGIDDPGVALFPRTYNSPSDHNPQTTVSLETVAQGGLIPLVTTEPNGTPPIGVRAAERRGPLKERRR